MISPILQIRNSESLGSLPKAIKLKYSSSGISNRLVHSFLYPSTHPLNIRQTVKYILCARNRVSFWYIDKQDRYHWKVTDMSSLKGQAISSTPCHTCIQQDRWSSLWQLGLKENLQHKKSPEDIEDG